MRQFLFVLARVVLARAFARIRQVDLTDVLCTDDLCLARAKDPFAEFNGGDIEYADGDNAKKPRP